MNVDRLASIEACKPGTDWTKIQAMPDQAWSDCERGDWLMWLLGATCAGEPWSDHRKPLVRILAECLAWILPKFPRGELRPRRMREVLAEWVNGTAGESDVKRARSMLYEYHNVSEDAASSAAAWVSYAPSFSWDVGGGMCKAVEGIAEVLDTQDGRDEVYARVARRVRASFPRLPEVKLRRYEVVCGGCSYRVTETVGDHRRDGPSVARVAAFHRHDFSHGGKNSRASGVSIRMVEAEA